MHLLKKGSGLRENIKWLTQQSDRGYMLKLSSKTSTRNHENNLPKQKKKGSLF